MLNSPESRESPSCSVAPHWRALFSTDVFFFRFCGCFTYLISTSFRPPPPCVCVCLICGIWLIERETTKSDFLRSKDSWCVFVQVNHVVHFQIKSPFEKVVLHTIIQVGRESLNFWRLSHHLCLWCTHTQPKCRRDPLTSFSIIHFVDSFLFRLQVQHPPAKFGVNSTHGQTM